MALYNEIGGDCVRENKNEDMIKNDAIRRLITEFTTFYDEIKRGLQDPDDYISISELEKLWRIHERNTSEIYSNTISDLIAAADQSELIKRKKVSTGRGE